MACLPGVTPWAFTNPIASAAFATQSKLSTETIDFRIADLGLFTLREASCGLFSFEANLGYGGSTIYYLDASPMQPLRLVNAPPILRHAANLVKFTSIRFVDVTQIDIADFVPFVVGRG